MTPETPNERLARLLLDAWEGETHADVLVIDRKRGRAGFIVGTSTRGADLNRPNKAVTDVTVEWNIPRNRHEDLTPAQLEDAERYVVRASPGWRRQRETGESEYRAWTRVLSAALAEEIGR